MPRQHVIEVPKLIHPRLCEHAIEHAGVPTANTLRDALTTALPIQSGRRTRGWRATLPGDDLGCLWLLLSRADDIAQRRSTTTPTTQIEAAAGEILASRIKAALHDHFIAVYPLGARIPTPDGIQTVDCVTVMISRVQVRTYADGAAHTWYHDQLTHPQEAIAS